MPYSIRGRFAFAVLAGIWLLCVPGWVQAAGDLYRAQTTVTGQGEENRAIGFERCLVDVLVKVSGLMQLADDPRLATHRANAGALVRSFSYVDQMSGKPKRDEQGTRDRPYDLIVDFDEEKINGVLAELNVRPWLSARPVVGVMVVMNPGAVTYAVSGNSKRSDLQKEALVAAAGKRGMRIVLPDDAMLEQQDLAAMPGPAVTAAMAKLGAQAALAGRLTWLDSELQWRAEWKLDWKGRLHQWHVRATTFDEVFRQSLGDALQIIAQDH